MPTYVKSFVSANNGSKKISSSEEVENNDSSNFLNFDPNVGLKARLYQKDRELVNKVLSQQESAISNSEKRDSILELIAKNSK